MDKYKASVTDASAYMNEEVEKIQKLDSVLSISRSKDPSNSNNQNTTEDLQQIVSAFLTNVLKKGNVDEAGNLIIPYSMIHDLLKTRWSPQNKEKKSLFNVNDSNIIYCVTCGSINISKEKKPNGALICNDCGCMERKDGYHGKNN